MLVLDTLNILHTVGVLPPDLAELDVQGVARLITVSRHASQRVVFVCDGLPTDDLPPAGPLVVPEAPSFHAEMRYSGRGTIADDLIRKMVDASTTPRKLIVVSSDHAVLRHANKRRCRTITSVQFLQQLADDARTARKPSLHPQRPHTISNEQVQGWIRKFDVNEQAIKDDADQHELPVVTPVHLDEIPPEPMPARPSRTAESTAPSNSTEDASTLTHDEALPADLIDEAELMWEAQRTATAPTTQQPPSTPEAVPPSSSVSGAPNAPQRDQPQEPSSIDALDDDIDALDMNAILPDDGRTLPIRRRRDRHRPAP